MDFLLVLQLMYCTFFSVQHFGIDLGNFIDFNHCSGLCSRFGSLITATPKKNGDNALPQSDIYLPEMSLYKRLL